MSSIKGMRRARAINVGALAVNIAAFGFDLAIGDVLLALMPATFVAVLAVLLCWQAKKIRLREYAARPRPDYSVIARMEREIYGEAFEHEGAPVRTARRSAPRWDGRTTHPDTTEPATADQYAAWLKGYVKHGGKPTHFYDYPFSRAAFRYASSDLVVDSDYEYGSSSRMIIIARNAAARRTNAAGWFGGWAHTKLYFMRGYQMNRPGFVPVYSDPEFDFARQEQDTGSTP